MRNLVAAEWLKARLGRSWLLTGAIGVLMSALTSYGYAKEGSVALAAGHADLAAVTDDVVRCWFMVFLFASVFGAIVVSKEYNSGTIGRSVLLGGNRGALFAAKLMAGAGFGAVFGLVAAVCAAISPWLMMSAFDLHPEWTWETTVILAGVFGCNVLAAVWGVFLAWIIRHQLTAVLTVIVLTLLVDPGLQRLVPEASGYLFTIALSSVYRDTKPDLLSEPVALVVAVAWLVVAGIAARQAFVRRDLT